MASPEQISRLIRVVAAVAFLLANGCAHQRTSEADLPVGKPRERAAEPASTPQLAASPGVLVPSERLQRDCDLKPPSDPTQVSDFNDGLLRIQGTDKLDRVALCMLQGSLRGVALTVTSYADDRNTGAYNQKLGVHRAQSVRDYLIFRGVPQSRIEMHSLHSREATLSAPTRGQPARNVELGEADDRTSSR